MTELPPVRNSISAKLLRLVLISVGLALGVAASLDIVQETRRFALGKRETLLATAQVFGAATSKAVASGDALAVLEAMRAVARVPGLLHAEVEDSSGKLLAELGSGVRLAGDLDLDQSRPAGFLDLLTSQTIQVSVPVIEGGRPVGRLRLVSENSDLLARLQRHLVTSALGLGIAVFGGLVIALRLQRSITRPLGSLVQTMAKVGRDHDYNAYIPVTADDETGVLASSFNSMIDDIREATNGSLAREEEIIQRLSRAAEQRDDQTGQHIMRMATLCRLVARGLGLDEKLSNDLYRAAPMHDVGKIGVPDAILFKPGRLDPDERREMEKHAQFGYEILRDSNSALIQLAAEIALSHHERWDGTGYPRRLSGERIPLSGRIAAVADVTDALASDRPYKKGWTLEAIRAFLVENAGTQFDPACVHALLERWSEVEALYAAKSADSPGPEKALDPETSEPTAA